jgi:hypothetical protein
MEDIAKTARVENGETFQAAKCHLRVANSAPLGS